MSSKLQLDVRHLKDEHSTTARHNWCPPL